MKIVQCIFAGIIILSSVYAQNHVLALDGNNDYVTLPQPIVESGDFSIEAWYFLMGDGGGIEHQNLIFSQRTNATGCDHSTISLTAKARPDLPNSSFSIRTNQGCSEIAAAQFAGTGQWHHLAGVKDGSEIRLYSDGELIASVPFTQNGNFASNINYIDIGRHQHDEVTYGSFYGLIDELRIWDVVLSHGDILSRMYESLDGNENGLLAYWDFEDSETEVLDQSMNGNNGTLMNGARMTESPRPTEIGFDILGDVNQDGQVSISDVIQLVNFILGN